MVKEKACPRTGSHYRSACDAEQHRIGQGDHERHLGRRHPRRLGRADEDAEQRAWKTDSRQHRFLLRRNATPSRCPDEKAGWKRLGRERWRPPRPQTDYESNDEERCQDAERHATPHVTHCSSRKASTSSSRASPVRGPMPIKYRSSKTMMLRSLAGGRLGNSRYLQDSVEAAQHGEAPVGDDEQVGLSRHHRFRRDGHVPAESRSRPRHRWHPRQRSWR